MSSKKSNRKPKSGTESESDVESLSFKLKKLTVSNEPRDINILLLGETGVGKSTFINAFFNYLQYPTLKKAKNGNFVTLIPVKFSITDENYEERVVQVGEDKNEIVEVGVSATQSCRSYVYPIEDGETRIRLIDTPGIGDTRGINQDNINFENVLSFIGEIKHLNAICILLKPNNSRLTVMFEFCIKQLLSRLEKSASKNLIFVFTNTRSTFYRPGDTLSPLKKLLETFQGVQIPVHKENIFCTDNEAFRFLAAVNNGLKFSPIDVDNFAQSWLKSVEECRRMIVYIAGDSNTVALIPHEVKNTISVNEARRLIVQLSQPLADIAQLIQDNIYALERHKSNLHQSNTTLTEMKAKLFIPVINLKVVPMDKPTTVCTSPKCSTLYKVGDKQKWHYHQKCHSPCYLTNVPKEIIGSPELASCAAMLSDGVCKQCSCRFQVHMHIYYETVTYDDRIEDASIKSAIMDRELALIHARNLVVKISRRVEEYKQERDLIIKTTAKFACFLKTNAIAPYNDAYQAYLEYLIDREKSMGDNADYEMIDQFKRMLLEYNEEKNALLNAISQKTPNMKQVTADDIMNSVRTLYDLKHNGIKIKELFMMQKGARKDENQSEVREFTYKHPKFMGGNDQKQMRDNENIQRNPRYGRNRSRGTNRNSPHPPNNQNAPMYSNRPRHHNQPRHSGQPMPNNPHYDRAQAYFPSPDPFNQNPPIHSNQSRHHNQPMHSGQPMPNNPRYDNAQAHFPSPDSSNQFFHIKQDSAGGVDIRFGANRPRYPQNTYIPDHPNNSSENMQQDYRRGSRYPNDNPPPYNQVPPPRHYNRQEHAPNTPYQRQNSYGQFNNQPPSLLTQNYQNPYNDAQNFNQGNQQQQHFNSHNQGRIYNKSNSKRNQPPHGTEKPKGKGERGYNSEPEHTKGDRRNNKQHSTSANRRHNLDDSDSDEYFSSTNHDRKHY